MAKGGARAGAGRKKGSKNKNKDTKLSKDVAKKAAARGVTPVEYMLKVMLNKKAPAARRDEMAKAVAPYIHPKLSSVDFKGDLDVTAEHSLSPELEQLVKDAAGRAGE